MLQSQNTEADPFSCSVSNNTVQIIKSCPKNESEWKKAAAWKNCSQYADQCDEPNKLVYHCVVNEFVNQTLEVCAIQQNIVGGFCSEYNELGNVIQLNYNRECGKFKPEPCPNFYLSSEAFKYPGCYKLVTPTTDSPANVSRNSMLWIILVTALIVIVMVVIVIVVCLKRIKKTSFKREGHEDTEKDLEIISSKGQQENCKQQTPLLIRNNVQSEDQEPET